MTAIQSTPDPGYIPLFNTTRSDTVESVYYGAVAVITPDGGLYAWAGNPDLVTFLRSAAKPFQAVPLVEMGGLEKFNISAEELAVICASHSSTDKHIKTIHGLMKKIGLTEDDLLCCSHQPFDPGSRKKLRDQGITPTPIYHNCSGKHTGMLAQAELMGAPKKKYTEINHPVQDQILNVFCEFCEMEPDQVKLARDGCSVPTFAVPLSRAARAWARLIYPMDFQKARQEACKKIINAMADNPFYVAGPGRLDTALMEVLKGKIVSKAGAEAFQGAGVYPGAIHAGSPPLGIAVKIASGDPGKRALNTVVIEILRQLGLVNEQELVSLGSLGDVQKYKNQCGILIGEGNSCFQLQYS
jgi:L-asparaginase II